MNTANMRYSDVSGIIITFGLKETYMQAQCGKSPILVDTVFMTFMHKIFFVG